MDASHADSGCAPPTTQCLQAEENGDHMHQHQHMPVPNNDTANTDALSPSPAILPDSSLRYRPHRISSAASTLSDQGSDVFSSYDSRRSTVSSVAFSEISSQPSSPQTPLTRSRENAKLLQAARLQRRRAESVNSAATNGTAATADDDNNNNDNDLDASPNLLRRRKRGASTKKYQPANPKAALAATEPPHENLLTKMAFAEQQRWITVQQKTFTKWLNTKIEARGLEVVDLVKDLSDGVSWLTTQYDDYVHT